MEPEVKTVVRMPQDVRDWFKSYAIENNRSMNGQLVSILKSLMVSEQKRSHGHGAQA